MSPSLNLRRSLALTTALVVTAFGAAPAVAYDSGKGNAGNEQSSQVPAQGAQKDKGTQKDKGGQSDTGQAAGNAGGNGNGNGPGSNNAGGNGNGNGPGSNNAGGNGNGNGPGSNNAGGNGNGNGPGNSNAGGNGGGKGDKGPKGDPAGNNGTVKITPIGEDDGKPQNTPHVVCGFDIEWYGFDEGDDIFSEVSLVPHAPTKDVTIDIGGPAKVFVGGDPASGAGTDTGFDGEATYYPTFSGGAPHPKQGYHVKLTIHTPGSQGADTKHKVLWIEPCEEEQAEEQEEQEEQEGEVAGTQQGTDDTSTSEETESPEVAGTQAAADPDSEVPTAVDAGENGNPVVNAITSPLGLLLMLGGLVIAGAAFIARRQTS